MPHIDSYIVFFHRRSLNERCHLVVIQIYRILSNVIHLLIYWKFRIWKQLSSLKPHSHTCTYHKNGRKDIHVFMFYSFYLYLSRITIFKKYQLKIFVHFSKETQKCHFHHSSLYDLITFQLSLKEIIYIMLTYWSLYICISWLLQDALRCLENNKYQKCHWL